MAKKYKCDFCGEILENPYKVKEEVISKTGNKRNVYYKYCHSGHYNLHIEYKMNKDLIVNQCKELIGGYNLTAIKLFNSYIEEFKYDTEPLLMLLDDKFLKIQIRLDDLIGSTLTDKVNYMFAIFRNNIHVYKSIHKEEMILKQDIEIMGKVRYRKRKAKRTFLDVLEER